MNDTARALLLKLLAQVDRGGRATLPITERSAKDYFSHSSLEARETIHAVLSNAERAGGVALEFGKGAASRDLVRLRIRDADRLASWLGVCRAAGHADLMARTLEPILTHAPDWLRAAYMDALGSWQLGKSALHIAHDDPDEAGTLFRIAVAVADNVQAGLDLRRFSAQLLGDSKAIENRLGRLAPLLRRNPQWSDLDDNSALFRTLGLEKFPPPVLLKGPLSIDYGDQRWDIGGMRPFVGMSPDRIRVLRHTSPSPYLLTVENMASFQRHVRDIDDDGIVIYTAGFPGPALAQVLRQLDAVLPQTCSFHHWGDRDLGGLRIFAKIEETYEVHPVRPHLMNATSVHCTPFARDMLEGLRTHAARDCAAGVLAAHWLASPHLGTLEQEITDPAPPSGDRAMSLQPKPTLSFEEWLEDERATLEGRSEFVDGEVFAMTGASLAHNAIVSNINREISIQLKGRPCQVYANDVKVLIRSAGAGKYPDLVALCGAPELLDDRRDVLLNPSLIVEVLSDSTEAYDRGDKFALYRRLPSLRDYVLVSQNRIGVELYTKGASSRWTLTDYTALTDSVPLTSIDCTLVLAEVYDKLDIANA